MVVLCGRKGLAVRKLQPEHNLFLGKNTTGFTHASVCSERKALSLIGSEGNRGELIGDESPNRPRAHRLLQWLRPLLQTSIGQQAIYLRTLVRPSPILTASVLETLCGFETSAFSNCLRQPDNLYWETLEFQASSKRDSRLCVPASR